MKREGADVTTIKNKYGLAAPFVQILWRTPKNIFLNPIQIEMNGEHKGKKQYRSRWEYADWFNYFNEKNEKKYTEWTDILMDRWGRWKRKRESLSWKEELEKLRWLRKNRAGEGNHTYRIPYATTLLFAIVSTLGATVWQGTCYLLLLLLCCCCCCCAVYVSYEVHKHNFFLFTATL